MTTILGMAKSGLDLRGAKSSKLELDVLRLIVAVQTIQAREEEAHGYVLVLDRLATTRVSKWLNKYDAVDCITCDCG